MLKDIPFLHFGQVEDNTDPLKSGRVRVRIYGFHSTSKTDIPTDELPWASVTINSIESQVGTSSIIPVGATVLIYCMDTKNFQDPIVIGVLSAKNDLHNQAIERGLEKSPVKTRLFNEPSNPYASKYPYNYVVSDGKSFIELDGTDDAERIQLYHTSGSFSEYHPDGKHVQRIQGDDFEIVLEDKNLFVKGNLNIAVDGDSKFDILGNVDIKAGKELNLSASDNVTITGKQIHLNTGSGISTGSDKSEIPDAPRTNQVFVSDTQPEGANEGDIWFDSSNNNQGHVFTGEVWEVTSNFSDTVGENEEPVIVNTNQTIESNNEPDYYTDGPFSNNDIWIDTSDSDTRYLWNNLTQTWTTSNSTNFGKSIISSGLSSSISKSLLVIFNSSSIPSGANEGDVWFRRDVGLVYKLKDNRWINFNNTFMDSQFNTLLENVTSSNIKFHITNIEPDVSKSGINDIWINASDYKKYDGINWITTTDIDFEKTFNIMAFDTSIHDGLIKILYSPVEPTENLDEGDVWIDISSDAETNQPKNHVYTYTSSTWVRITDSDIENAYVQSASFEAIRDGKINVYFSENIPDSTFSPIPSLGDLWFDISDEVITDDTNFTTGDVNSPNTPTTQNVPRFDQYRFNGDNWVSLENYKISDIEAKLNVETIIREDQTGALSLQITTAETSIDENSTIVQEAISSIDGIVGTYGVSFDTNGVVSGFNIVTNYTSEITLDTGNDFNYRIGEDVYIGSNLATSSYNAKVVSWNRNTKKLKVVSENGTYTNNQLLIGEVSGTQRLTTIKEARVDFGTTVKFDTTNFIIADTSTNTEVTPFSIRNGVVYIGEVDTQSPQITYIGEFANNPATTFNLNSIYKNTSDNNTYVLEDINGTPTWNLFLQKGNDGTDGIQGPAGEDGQPTYTWIKYADDINGSGLTNLPAGKNYIGIAYNKNTQTESNNASDYTFSLIKGDSGTNGVDGVDGIRGSKTFYASTTNTSWTDTVADNTIAAQSYTKVINDIVTQYNTSVGFSETRFWDGTSWSIVTQVIDGNLVVQGTIGADKIVAGTTFTQSLYVGATNLELDGGNNRIVVSDGTNSRVIIGDTDGNGSYGIVIKDASGNDIINQGGIQLTDTTTLNGNNLFNNLGEFFTDISTSEAAASSSAITAQNSYARTRPKTFEDGGKYFTTTILGSPDTISDADATGELQAVSDATGDYIRNPLTSIIASIFQKHGIPYIVGNRYKVTARVRRIAGTGATTKLYGHMFNDDYSTSHGKHEGVSEDPPSGVGQTFTYEFNATQANYDAGVRKIKAEVLLNDNGGERQGIYFLDIEDITSEYNADISATVATTQAVIASDSAASASNILEVISQVNQGQSWLTNPSFVLWNDGAVRPKGYGEFGTSSTGTWSRETTIKKFSDASRHNVTVADDFGMIAYSNILKNGGLGDSIYGVTPNLQTVQYFVVECWVYLVSGSWNGSGVLIMHRGTSGFIGSRVVNFGEMSLPTGEWVNIKKFINWGTVDPNTTQHHVYAMSNYNFPEGYANKDLIWGSISVRNATDMEIEASRVIDVEASVIVQSNTVASLAGFAGAYHSINVDSNGVIAGIALRSETNGTVSQSDIKISADNITLESGSAIFSLIEESAALNVPLIIYSSTGNTMTVFGSDFGTNSDLSIWSGLTREDLNQCRPSNAKWAFDNNGRFYLAGNVQGGESKEGSGTGASTATATLTNANGTDADITAQASRSITEIVTNSNSSPPWDSSTGGYTTPEITAKLEVTIDGTTTLLQTIGPITGTRGSNTVTLQEPFYDAESNSTISGSYRHTRFANATINFSEENYNTTIAENYDFKVTITSSSGSGNIKTNIQFLERAV